jgi:hypothetical protein
VGDPRKATWQTFFLAAVLTAAAVAPFAGARPNAATNVMAGCRPGSTPARINGKKTCLRRGKRCNPKYDRQFHRYRFHCHRSRRLTRAKPAPPPLLTTVIRPSGPEKVVYDWTTDRCENVDIPDFPVRAFRDAGGRVQLITGNDRTRRLAGPDFEHLTRDCSILLVSDLNPDPAAFDDHEWIGGTYTLDGTTVYALVHDEYQGNTHAGRCPSGVYLSCWYNAITLAVSTDGGNTYVDHFPRLVASIPYQYVADGGPAGVFAPSSIVHNPADGYYYAFVYRATRDSYVGNCLLRTQDLGDPSSWRAWSGGTNFDTTFVDPYGPLAAPADHLCRPVSIPVPGDMQPNSLTFSTVTKKWMLVGQATAGFFSSLSPDLIHWSPPELFMDAKAGWDYRCGDPDPIAYPSLIDPGSPSRNFETTGTHAYLYFTRTHYSGCSGTLDRDLIRVPVTIHPE